MANSMLKYFKPLTISFISISIIAVVAFNYLGTKSKSDYNTQVKPIINRKCIACHGGVKKQGGFSFLFEDEAKAKLKSGKYAIVPFKPNESELIARINSKDDEERMPHNHNPLSKDEISVFTQWIKQGAPWGIHWAYETVKQPEIPGIHSDWAKNNIDKYVLQNLKKESYTPSSSASAPILARRAALDIIGFQAPDSITLDFTQNPSDKTYEEFIDKLLSSPHYGEKWTSMWLDLARYADTKGYEKDANRSIWKYKNWLINAFNDDMPYDQFLKEQIAGDLIPNATDEELLATAFNRNTMTNDEGGTDNEEFRTAAVIDRVNTTWQTLMGTTFACVQCHSHPYDPFKHEDYYKFMAYFNNTRDADTEEEYPWLRHFKPEQKRSLDSLTEWLSNKISAEEVKSVETFIKTLGPSFYSMECDQYVNSSLIDTKWLSLRENGSVRMPQVPLDNNDQLVLTYQPYVKSGYVQFRLGELNGPIIAEIKWNKPMKGWNKIAIPLKTILGRQDVYITLVNGDIVNKDAPAVLFNWFHFTKKFPGTGDKEYLFYEKKYWDLLNAETVYTPILMENPKPYSRTTQVFERGNWLVKSDTVSPGLPEIFNHGSIKNPKSRMDLAEWMTAADNPLTARVIVNRFWEQIWGTGLVETLEDFGSQGANPKNQELLDYLAYHFIYTHHWSLKALLKEILMSATYRQDSKMTAEARKKDLFNELLARGPRVRLSAEQIRDQTLAACGLIDSIYEGPPVMPYQPEGVWESPYNSRKWVKSKGKNQYLRSLYTFWKRTAAYPSMTNFDATGREVCVARRIRTNTPLQALTILNDSVYIDLASQLVKASEASSPEATISKAYHLVTGKDIDDTRMQLLRKLYYESYIHFLRSDQIIGTTKTKALNLVANTILNLDEVITKS